ncbi:hypothetical protein KQ874_01270 [Mycoplasma sp. ES3157-GEN-MYC]|uniref:Uncharacterized protein n=1 Tax=Mycoplasma miroungigenitalium TaxID=754515 RepID=A0A6M4J8V9_9MOLU|nr:hypothetical protein [Mycoplasma miroungigenitalium]MBU4690319.1 hypothetical protein [Mycoplasma miroungigenitalium]MBU4691586.1 hypothetical protein [Mycoplasma miroungigenitalium]QJR43414.1 hypothetical protein HLA87_01260 [Mycoplasma miroungigenitalium]
MFEKIKLIKDAMIIKDDVDHSKSTNEEASRILFNNKGHKIEIIHSFEYNSDWMINNDLEHAFLIKGTAILEDENRNVFEMSEGDCLRIEKNVKHKIIKTSQHAIWLAIHIGDINE